MPACAKCHRDIAAGALFCAYCGAAIAAEQASAGADPLIGKTFRGVYFLQQKIGQGGMGQVYRARHVTLDVPVAVKILNRALLSDPTVVQRFHREARAASRLRHPNVISVTDFGEADDGLLFMVMEYLAGKNLARIIADEAPLPERRAVHIAAQVLAALAEAHANGILHRDLKPENVMVEVRRDEPDAVKVLDFGIAKIQVAGDGQKLTQHGLVCGTPGYMSPEQWEDRELDGRSDLYSVGVILYEMLTGKLPFEARTPMEMMRKHLTEHPEPPSARRKLSPDLDALVMRALSANRDERPASAEAMRLELLSCVLLPDDGAERARGAAEATTLLRRTPGATRRRGNGPGTPAGGASRPTPNTERLATPGPRPKRTPAGSQGRSSDVARRRTPTPRHEEDEPEEGEERSSAPPPPPPRPIWLYVAGGAVALAVAVGVGVAVKRSGPHPEPPRPPHTPTPAPALAVSPAARAIAAGDGGAPFTAVLTGSTATVSWTLAGPGAISTTTGGTTAYVPPPSLPAGSANETALLTARAEGLTAVAMITVTAPATPPATLSVNPAAQSVQAGGGGATFSATLSGSDAAITWRIEGRGTISPTTGPRTTYTPPAALRAPTTAKVTAVTAEGLAASATVTVHPAKPPGGEHPPPACPTGGVFIVRDALNAIPTPSAASGEGILSVLVEPYGEVFLDGKPYGDAPREFRLPACTYLVAARHPQLGKREARVTVRAGERVRWATDFLAR